MDGIGEGAKYGALTPLSGIITKIVRKDSFLTENRSASLGTGKFLQGLRRLFGNISVFVYIFVRGLDYQF